MTVWELVDNGVAQVGAKGTIALTSPATCEHCGSPFMRGELTGTFTVVTDSFVEWRFETPERCEACNGAIVSYSFYKSIELPAQLEEAVRQKA